MKKHPISVKSALISGAAVCLFGMISSLPAGHTGNHNALSESFSLEVLLGYAIFKHDLYLGDDKPKDPEKPKETTEQLLAYYGG